MSFHNIGKYHDLWRVVALNLVLALVNRIPHYMRGATIGFDGETIRLTFIFERSPDEREEQNMQDVEAEIVSCHEYQSDLTLSVVPVTESIIDKVDNWGWVFLRLDDQSTS